MAEFHPLAHYALDELWPVGTHRSVSSRRRCGEHLCPHTCSPTCKLQVGFPSYLSPILGGIMLICALLLRSQGPPPSEPSSSQHVRAAQSAPT